MRLSPLSQVLTLVEALPYKTLLYQTLSVSNYCYFWEDQAGVSCNMTSVWLLIWAFQKAISQSNLQTLIEMNRPIT